MTCADFEKNFDLYVDDMLAGRDFAAAREHLDACPSCETAVTHYQQTRAMLSTAVADIATAVDVSGIWSNVERALVADGTIRTPTVERAPAKLSDVWSDLRERVLDAVGLSPVGYVWRVGFAGGASAVAASVLFLSLQDGDFASDTVASGASSARPTVSRSNAPVSNQKLYAPVSASELRPASKPWPGVGDGAALAALGALNLVVEPRPSVQKARAVRAALASRALGEPVRVDSVRSAPGHHVTTWADPQTRNRVIWVAPGKDPTAERAEYRR